jgi:NAD(P)-dependent dehydrogenase (short-subunit alcohol dehydrogenase family)
VTQALLPALRKGDRKFVLNITSMLGSIEGNTRGGSYGYRESKAALNMFTRSLAAELKSDGFTCIAMSPGWVKTDMGGPNARLTPDESIDAIVKVIEGLGTEHSGSFYNHAGEIIDW